jgi:lysyl-tRNA synthetase class 2
MTDGEISQTAPSAAQGRQAGDAASDDPIEVRRAKRAAAIARGEEPYAREYILSDHACDLEQRHAGLGAGEASDDAVSVAGRIMAIRDQGKVAFIVIRDATGDLQLFCRIDDMGEEGFARLAQLDIGDWVGARGLVMRTRRGQLSVAPVELTLLTKALRPLPEKFHGLADKETRYRQRYVDLVMSPEVRSTFEKRFKIIAAIRREAEAMGFLEVETPMLHPIPGGATARPFVTHHNALDRDFYLRIAPELYLKRLLVGGFERVFEINRSFRNEGMDHSHNPEFTMLEAYQAFTDIHGIAEFTRRMIQAAARAASDSLLLQWQGNTVDLSGEWPKRTMIELVSEALGQDAGFNRSLDELRDMASRNHIATESSWGRGKLITELYEKLVEPNLMRPTFVIEHPLETSPLAKKKAGSDDVTDRFELLICGREFANGFSELNDPVDQHERFVAQARAKAAGDDEAMGFDEDYIRALEYGMPPAGGVGIGIDRLVMLLCDCASIRDVLLFPHMREEAER